jgi:hypothetical protein
MSETAKPELLTEHCPRCGVNCVAGFCGACHLQIERFSDDEIQAEIDELVASIGPANRRTVTMLEQLREQRNAALVKPPAGTR